MTLINRSFYEMDRNFLNDIVKNLPGIIFWKDINSVYLGCNDKLLEIFGATDRNQILGKTDLDFRWDKIEAQRIINDDKEVMQTGLEKKNIYERVPLIDNSFIDVLTTKVPLYNNNNKIVGILATAIDITELKKTQTQLEKAKEKAETMNEAKSRFLAMASHELRTPLNGITMTLDLFPKEHLSEEQKQYLGYISRSTQDLLHIINDILDFTKLEAKKHNLFTETFDLKMLINDAMTSVKHFIGNKKISLQLDYPAHLPNTITADALRLKQILTNLLTNAIKFTEKGYIKIWVEVHIISKTHAELRLSVEDTGVGIPEDKLETVFEQFEQVSNKMYNRTHGGMGLGLAICKGFTELMGGKISVESQLGVGSTFILTLPVELASPVEESIETPSDISLLSSHGIRILLVEDHPINQMLTMSLLKKLGHHVDIASTGEEALQKACENIYDLILMDIQLPDMNGMDITQKIRTDIPKNKNAPILAVTAHMSEAEYQQFLKAGMEGVLPKPITMASLETALKSYAQKK